MSKIKLTGSNSGYVEIDSAADAGNLTLSLPTSGTRLLSNTDNVFSGITTTGQLDINGSIDVSSTSVFNNDLTLTGASYNVQWDKTDNQLEFGDNAKISFGGQADMRLFHDGTNSVITNATGDLYVNNNADIIIKPANDCFIKPQDGENGIKVIGNGAVELYHNNVKKFETTNTGAVVTGICTATSFSGSGEGLTRTTQLSHRNKVINGAMQVAQRGTTFTFSSGSTLSAYTIDNFRYDLFPFGGTSATATVTRSGTAPDGFTNSLKVDVTATDTSLVGNNYSQVNFQLERQDIRNFAYGTSSAKSITLSFYVRSNKTGNYNVNMLAYGTSTRLASFQYTISSANTWERKTITVAGDTAGNIVSGTDSGLSINFGLAYGGNYITGTNQNSFGSYVAANQGVGQDVNLYDSTSNNWYITGVQLEVGSVATPFEHRSFSDELTRCSRYLQIFHVPTNDSYRASNITATVHGTGGGVYLNVAFTHPMRTAPSLTVDGAFGGNVFTGSWSGATLSSITAEYSTDARCTLGFNGITSASVTGSHTTGLTGQIYTANNGSNDAALIYSAEL